jgi:putative membrane protein
MMWWYGPGWGGMLWMGLGSLFWLVLLGLAIWLLVRWLTRSTASTMSQVPPAPPNSPSALEILRQRYARGEIDTPTFEAMRERLQATPERDEQFQRV